MTTTGPRVADKTPVDRSCQTLQTIPGGVCHAGRQNPVPITTAGPRNPDNREKHLHQVIMLHPTLHHQRPLDQAVSTFYQHIIQCQFQRHHCKQKFITLTFSVVVTFSCLTVNFFLPPQLGFRTPILLAGTRAVPGRPGTDNACLVLFRDEFLASSENSSCFCSAPFQPGFLEK